MYMYLSILVTEVQVVKHVMWEGKRRLVTTHKHQSSQIYTQLSHVHHFQDMGSIIIVATCQSHNQNLELESLFPKIRPILHPTIVSTMQ